MRWEPYDVYIGRPGHGEEGYFGNPHPIGYCPICRRLHPKGEAIGEFKKDFYRRLMCDAEFLRRVVALRGQRLGCFCKPDKCHGDVIKEWLDSLPSP